MKLTFITGNTHKAEQLAKWLGYPVAHHKLDLDEIQSMDGREVVAHKARQAYEILQSPALVEDISLELHALGGLPGPFVKWFVQEIGTEGICRLLGSYDDRRATTRICYGLCDGNDVRFFEGVKHGTIAPEPRGEGGFGYDRIFINDGYDQTRGEMDEATYAATSHRKEALGKLREFLTTQA